MSAIELSGVSSHDHDLEVLENIRLQKTSAPFTQVGDDLIMHNAIDNLDDLVRLIGRYCGMNPSFSEKMVSEGTTIFTKSQNQWFQIKVTNNQYLRLLRQQANSQEN
jgi:hypothetical protein